MDASHTVFIVAGDLLVKRVIAHGGVIKTDAIEAKERILPFGGILVRISPVRRRIDGKGGRSKGDNSEEH